MSEAKADGDFEDRNLYINRELSWLAFNQRVLDQARDAHWPLLERLKFLAIFASNLDEFFEVRFADCLEASRQPGTGITAADIVSLAVDSHALIDDHYAVSNYEDMPAPAPSGPRQLPHHPPTALHSRRAAAARQPRRVVEGQDDGLAVLRGFQAAHQGPGVARHRRHPPRRGCR